MFQNPGYMKENFYIVIETMHYGDTGISDNVSWMQSALVKRIE